MITNKLAVAAVALVAITGTANAADLYSGSSKDAPSYEPAGTVGGWWLDGGIGGKIESSTAKGTASTTVNLNSLGINVTGAPFSFQPTAPIQINGVNVTDVTVTCAGTGDTRICSAVGTGKVKSHLSPVGIFTEARGGYAFQLGNGWFAGPALGLGYSGENDSITYSGALELGRKWGNAQLKVGAGYLAQHVSGVAFDTSSFSKDTGGFMGLIQGDLFVNKNTSLFVRVEEVANGSFNNTDVDRNSYKVNTYDTLAVAGVGVHW